ncbi:MAG: hypothetical protein DMF64_09580 [Acidobacteria bacterium]|nr:MAG: hypothetical protein DMF64_09580 [Acidobacteriota bacterium]
MPEYKFKAHGYVGLVTIVAAEVLLFAGQSFVGHWFTPIVWTGYVLFMDALVYRRKGRSLLVSNRLELLVICLVSIACWWLFEFYNTPRFWRTDLALWWHYTGLEPNPYLRRVGYDWAFATIFPALFETAEWLNAGLRRDEEKPTRAIKLPRPLLYALVVVGAIGAALPFFIISTWLVPLVWTGLFVLLDPLNALRGWPAITSDLARKRWRRLAALCLAGLICGLLWEFWNYWALARWTYTVPYFGHIKLFEMPVVGYLGYLPFALECWALYVFARSLLGSRPIAAQTSADSIVIDLQ